MIPIIGYVNKLSARPGETLDFKISSSLKSPYEASLIRIRCADANPDGPGIREENINAAFAGSYPSNFKDVNSGSYGLIKSISQLNQLQDFTLSAKIWPTLTKKRTQSIISWKTQEGFTGLFGIDEAGNIFAQLGKQKISTSAPLMSRKWYHVWISFSAKDNLLSCNFTAISTRTSEVHSKQTTLEQPINACLLYTSPSPRDGLLSRMPSSA